MNTSLRTSVFCLVISLVCSVQAQEKKKSRNSRFEPEYTSREFKGTNDAALTYGWLAPLESKAGDKYPLVICLHGSGGSVRASAVLVRKEMREKYPAFVMVPKAEAPLVWARTDLIRRRGAPEVTPEKLPVLIEAVQSLLKSESIDPARVYITGQSLGGIGSWGAIATHPDLFAAAAPVCGAWKVDDASKMVSVPVWTFHGADDQTVKTQFTRDLTAALTKAGGKVKYTEYPGVGHDSWLKAYEDPELWTWLFAQKKGSTVK